MYLDLSRITGIRAESAINHLSGTLANMYHTAKNINIHSSFQFQQPSFLLSILVIVGITSGSFIVYNILDMNRNRNNRKAQFKNNVKKLESDDDVQ